MAAEAVSQSAPLVAAPSRLALLYAALVALMAAPLAVWPIPPTWDLVNHWARLTLWNMPDGDPLVGLYQTRLSLIPNLAVDLVDLAVSPPLSPQTVVQLAWIASFALPAWGVWRLSKALHGAPQPIVLVAPILSYNLVTTLGLVNFALGMGLAIHALAWWLTIDRRRIWTRLALFNGVAVALFFCHIAAYAAFCLVVGFVEAAPRMGEGWRAWLSRVALTPLFVVAGAALWLFAPPFDGRFSGAGAKIASLAAPMIANGRTTGLVETVALAILLAVGLLSRGLTLASAMRWPLAALLTAIVALPPASGAADFVDARLAVLFAYLAVASLAGPRDPTAAGWLAAAAVIAVVARVGEAAPTWSAYARQAHDMRQMVRVIAPGAKVLVAESPVGACAKTNDDDYARGLTPFVVIDRRALVSTLFAGRGMQPVERLDPRMDGGPALATRPAWFASHDGADGRPDWRSVYDTLIALHVGCDWRPDLPGLTAIAEGRDATVYRVR